MEEEVGGEQWNPTLQLKQPNAINREQERTRVVQVGLILFKNIFALLLRQIILSSLSDDRKDAIMNTEDTGASKSLKELLSTIHPYPPHYENTDLSEIRNTKEKREGRCDS